MGGVLQKIRENKAEGDALWTPEGAAAEVFEANAAVQERKRFVADVDRAARTVAIRRADASRVFVKIFDEPWKSKRVCQLLSETHFSEGSPFGQSRLPREMSVSMRGRVMRAKWGDDARDCSYKRSFVAVLMKQFAAEEVDAATMEMESLDIEGQADVVQDFLDQKIVGVAIVREHYWYAQEDPTSTGEVASPPVSDEEDEDEGELDAIHVFKRSGSFVGSSDEDDDDDDDEAIEPGTKLKVWEVTRIETGAKQGSRGAIETGMRIAQELEFLGSELDVMAMLLCVDHVDVGPWLQMPQANKWVMVPQILRSPLDDELSTGLDAEQQQILEEAVPYFSITYSPLNQLGQLYSKPGVFGESFGPPYRYHTGETNHLWVSQAHYVDDGLRNRKSTKMLRPQFDIAAEDQRRQRTQRDAQRKTLRRQIRSSTNPKRNGTSKAQRKHQHALPAGYTKRVEREGKEEMKRFAKRVVTRAAAAWMQRQ